MASSKIIVLSDGTGNAASSVWRTNVWRMFQALDLQGNTQAAKYDDGVGTSSFIPLAVLGGVFGYGLKRNVLDAYKFICRNYDHQNHSKIYLFGFSRGAFTARVLAALILEQGLVMAETESELHDGAVKAYRTYRAEGYHSIWRVEVLFRALRDWPLELPNRVLSPRIKWARHTLALDDERTTFHPVLWTEQKPGEPVPATIDDQQLTGAFCEGTPDDKLIPIDNTPPNAAHRSIKTRSKPTAAVRSFFT